MIRFAQSLAKQSLHRRRGVMHYAPTLGIVFVFALSPLQAFAAPITTSPYTQQVLERADKGIDYAFKDGDAVQDFFLYQLSWIQTIGSVFASFVDTRVTIGEQNKSLLDMSACLRIDLFLIEEKLEEVRQKQREAYEQQNLVAIVRLLDLAQFLNERYQFVLFGARDPYLTDTTWEKGRSFEEPRDGYCCAEGIPGNACQPTTETSCVNGGGVFTETKDQCVAYGCLATPDNVCAFSSDYLPPSVEGYGCDDEAMEKVLAKLSEAKHSQKLKEATQAESDALKGVRENLEQYINESRAVLELEREINDLLGRDTELPEVPPARKHKVINGCLDKNAKWPDGLVQWDLRGVFAPSPGKDEQQLLQSFNDLRQAQGLSRPSSEDFALRSWQSGIERFIRDYAQSVFQLFSREQGSRESATFAIASDPGQVLADTAKPFSKAVERLAKLAKNINKDEKGLRDFVRDYASP